MSIQIAVEVQGIAEAAARLNRLAGVAMEEIGEAVGKMVARQHERRIRSEKTSPDGAAWKPSRDNPDTLVRSGRLAGSIDYTASATEVRVGSTLGEVYPAVHQAGAVITPKSAKVLRFFAGGNGAPVFARKVTVPARPWLGLSAANEAEVERELVATLEDLLGGAP